MAGTDKQPLWRTLRDGRATADAIRKHLGAGEPPIAVARIASALGVELAEGTAQPYAGYLSLAPDRAWLWTSRDEGKEQRRYTIAVLLAHVMRMPYGEYRLPFNHEGLWDQPEVSSFARELLMPREVLRRLLFEGNPDEAIVAARLGVSTQHLARRIKELDLPSTRALARTITEQQKPVQASPPTPAAPEAMDDSDFIDIDGEDEVTDEDRTDPGRTSPGDDDEDRAKTDPDLRYSQRREHERVQARFEVRFSLPGQAANALRAYSKDISMGGLCLKAARSYEAGELLELHMVVGAETYDLKARVAWKRDEFIGVRFTDLSEQDRERLGGLINSLKR